MLPSLSQLNALDRTGFVSQLGWIYEHSPWVAEQAWEYRPLATIEDLHAAMERVVELAPPEKKLALILAHPDLAAGLAKVSELTSASRREQAGAGLNHLTSDQSEQMRNNNARYRERFGFPFIICARLNNAGTILNAFAKRLENSQSQEIAVALEEISKIGRLRLESAIMKGKLSTHVLDIENGVAAGGLSIALWRLNAGERALLKDIVTNPEGRTDEPLLSGAEMQAGEYEMVFQVGAYFGLEPEKSFLNAVPIRFRIINPDEGYHVPLLVSRWAYNTYRGS